MGGHGKREATLLADAIHWRDRVLADVRGAKGRAAADAHQLPIELVAEAEKYPTLGIKDTDLIDLRPSARAGRTASGGSRLTQICVCVSGRK
jgi:hypothetical protein